MSDNNDIGPTEDQLMERSRATMNRMILIIQKVKDGTATESELAEHRKIRDEIDRIPVNTLIG